MDVRRDTLPARPRRFRRLALMAIALVNSVAPGLTTAATASSPEGQYFAFRDERLAYFAQFKNKSPTKDDLQAEVTALRRMQSLLQPIVGDARVRGATGTGKLSIVTLTPAPDFGLLDALEWDSTDGNTRIFVTTDALLGHWLADNRLQRDFPKARDALLQSSSFVGSAIFYDATLSWYARIPVKPVPGSSLTAAFWGALSQDFPGPAVPDRIEVIVAKANRVYLIDAATTTARRVIPACTKLQMEYERRDEAQNAQLDLATHPELQAESRSQASRIGSDWDQDRLKCFATYLPKQAFFRSLILEAQALADRVTPE